MKVTQDKLPDSQIGLEIEIPPESSKKTYDKVIKDLMKKSQVPGFRKGKVPRPILIQRIGKERIHALVLEELIQDSLQEAIEQESIESIGNYSLKSEFDDLLAQYKPGEALTFSAAVDVPPTVTLGDYQTLSIQAEKFEPKPEQVEEFLQEKQEAQSTLIPVEDRPAQAGDVAIVDYAGKFVGSEEIIEGVEGTEFQVELIEGQLVPGMVEGMIGMTLDETKEITVTFPEDYAREDLAGEEVVFTVTLKELKEKELPELDDDFAQDVSEFETMAELRASLEQEFQQKAEQQTKNSIDSALIEALVEISRFDLPNTLIQDETNKLLTESAMQLQQMGIDVNQLFTAETIPAMRERTRPDAIANLKQSLALAEVIEQESISVSEEEIQAKIKEIQEKSPNSDYDMEKLTNYVSEDLEKTKALACLEDKATVELVPEGTLTEPEEDEETVLEGESEPEVIEAETVEVEATEAE